MTSKLPYHSDDYKRSRMICFVRDGFMCQICGCRRFKRLTAHHITPLSAGGSHNPDNLVTLCEDCHGELHQAEQTGRAVVRVDILTAELLEAAAELIAA